MNLEIILYSHLSAGGSIFLDDSRLKYWPSYSCWLCSSLCWQSLIFVPFRTLSLHSYGIYQQCFKMTLSQFVLGDVQYLSSMDDSVLSGTYSVKFEFKTSSINNGSVRANSSITRVYPVGATAVKKFIVREAETERTLRIESFSSRPKSTKGFVCNLQHDINLPQSRTFPAAMTWFLFFGLKVSLSYQQFFFGVLLWAP